MNRTLRFSFSHVSLGSQRANNPLLSPLHVLHLQHSSSSIDSAFKGVRKLVSKKKKRFKSEGFDLDLSYITPQIVAMGFPSAGAETLYRNPMNMVEAFFEMNHGVSLMELFLNCVVPEIKRN